MSRGVAGDHLFLDLVERYRQTVGDPVHGVGNILHDRLKQRGHAVDPLALLERTARRIDGTAPDAGR